MERWKPKYVLTQLVLGKQCEIKLRKREYDQIAKAKKGLSKALAIEERYDVLIANFEELELEILRIANRNQ